LIDGIRNNYTASYWGPPVREMCFPCKPREESGSLLPRQRWEGCKVGLSYNDTWASRAQAKTYAKSPLTQAVSPRSCETLLGLELDQPNGDNGQPRPDLGLDRSSDDNDSRAQQKGGMRCHRVQIKDGGSKKRTVIITSDRRRTNGEGRVRATVEDLSQTHGSHATSHSLSQSLMREHLNNNILFMNNSNPKQMSRTNVITLITRRTIAHTFCSFRYPTSPWYKTNTLLLLQTTTNPRLTDKSKPSNFSLIISHTSLPFLVHLLPLQAASSSSI
jgi:hypothetical protein